MSSSEDRPFSQSHLDSTAYRARLLRKLNTLIAVLEVACAKVRRTLQGPDPDVERLTRIHQNLRDTLSVCLRAKTALQRREKLPASLPPILGLPGEGEDGAESEPIQGEGEFLDRRVAPKEGSPREALEHELGRFQGRAPITPEEIRRVDLDELCNKLLFG